MASHSLTYGLIQPYFWPQKDLIKLNFCISINSTNSESGRGVGKFTNLSKIYHYKKIKYLDDYINSTYVFQTGVGRVGGVV